MKMTSECNSANNVSKNHPRIFKTGDIFCTVNNCEPRKSYKFVGVHLGGDKDDAEKYIIELQHLDDPHGQTFTMAAPEWFRENKIIMLPSKLLQPFECESADCVYNSGEGECRYSLVKGENPRITEDDGCTCYCDPYAF